MKTNLRKLTNKHTTKVVTYVKECIEDGSATDLAFYIVNMVLLVIAFVVAIVIMTLNILGYRP
jgi:hypothetical protein